MNLTVFTMLIAIVAAAGCSESEFTGVQNQEKDKKPPPEEEQKPSKGKARDPGRNPEEPAIEMDPIELAQAVADIELENPYQPEAGTTGSDGSAAGGGGTGEAADEADGGINTAEGEVTANDPEILTDDGEITMPKLTVYFIDPARNEQPAAISVTNSETFEFGWKSSFTTSCKVFVRRSADPAPGSERDVGGATSGTTPQSRITSAHTFTAECIYKDQTGAEGKLTESLEATVDGGWFNAVRAECPAFCAGIGKVNAPSPDGFSCTSGEERPVSAIGVVDFTPTGCWHSCALPEGAAGAVSEGFRCYHPAQKRDHDSTDTTVGCYCRKP